MTKIWKTEGHTEKVTFIKNVKVSKGLSPLCYINTNDRERLVLKSELYDE
jgi:hypothetical protein